MPCTASGRPPGRLSKKGALCADRQGEPGRVVPPAATVPRRAVAAAHPGPGATGVRRRARPGGALAPRHRNTQAFWVSPILLKGPGASGEPPEDCDEVLQGRAKVRKREPAGKGRAPGPTVSPFSVGFVLSLEAFPLAGHSL